MVVILPTARLAGKGKLVPEPTHYTHMVALELIILILQGLSKRTDRLVEYIKS